MRLGVRREVERAKEALEEAEALLVFQGGLLNPESQCITNTLKAGPEGLITIQGGVLFRKNTIFVIARVVDLCTWPAAVRSGYNSQLLQISGDLLVRLKESETIQRGEKMQGSYHQPRHHMIEVGSENGGVAK